MEMNVISFSLAISNVFWFGCCLVESVATHSSCWNIENAGRHTWWGIDGSREAYELNDMVRMGTLRKGLPRGDEQTMDHEISENELDGIR